MNNSTWRQARSGGWEYDLYQPLIVAGLVKGNIDGDGFIEELDGSAREDANDLIFQAIDAVFERDGE